MDRRRRSLLLALLLAIAVLPVGIAAPRWVAGPAGVAAMPAADYCADAEEQAFLGLINTYRAQNGLAPLAMSQAAGAAADHHSISMANNNYFSHDLVPEGIGWSQNMTNHGYTHNTWRGENIAAGYATAAQTFEQWRNSPPHNANMLNANFTVIGIGRAYNAGSTYKWYWTTDFGGVVDPAARLCGGASPAPTVAPSPGPTAPGGGTPYAIVRSGRTSNSNSSLNAYDGNASTSWYTTVSQPPSSAYIYVDLGASKSIGTIRWLFSQTGGADAMAIQISTDLSNWTTLATVGNAPAGTWQSLAVNRSARFVRFSFTNPNRDPVLGYLAEVQVTS